MHPPRLRLLLGLAALVLASPAVAAVVPVVPSRNIQLVANFNDFPPVSNSPFGAGYASCWGYIHPDGREYAIIGTTRGIAIYNVTNLNNCYLVDSIPGISSAWREMKSYRYWIYVVTEGYTNTQPDPTQGLQIIRMTDPEHPVLAATYNLTFNRSHTVSVDTTNALLICNGTNLTGPGSPYPSQTAMGMRILSIANPEAPVELASWPGGTGVPSNQYVHDCRIVGNRVYAASIYSDSVRVIDISSPANPTEIAAWTYPNSYYTHNCWPDKTEKFIYVTDERNGETLRVFDISNLAVPTLVNEITSNPKAIVHNAHVKDDELYLANYTEGIRILDISDPAHPAEFGYADSYPGPSGGYAGVWGIYPYFPSGTVIASDMQTGLYVYSPQRNYGLIRATVVDASTSLPMPGAKVYLTTQGDSLTSPNDGIVQFGPSPGSHTVEARRFGYENASATRVVSVGSHDAVTLAMVKKPVVMLSGTVKDAVSQAVLDSADIVLDYSPLSARSDGSGHYTVAEVPSDPYRIEVRRAGYIPLVFTRQVGPGSDVTQDLYLQPARSWDALETDSGWTVGGAGTGDNATSGQWVRVAPLGTSIGTAALSLRDIEATFLRPVNPEHEELPPLAPQPPVQVQPALDHTPPPGTMCFVTGQGTDPGNPTNGDVDGGKTSLTSPVLDMTGMADPTIGFWRWFYTDGDANDWFVTLISNDNGATWVSADTLRGIANHWTEAALHVANYVVPTNQVRVRFVVADFGGGSAVEGAVDDITIYDGATPAAVNIPNAPHPGRLALSGVRPNPSRGSVGMTLELPRTGNVEVMVVDLTGRRVRTLLHGAVTAGALPLTWDGRDQAGNVTPAGLYFIRARAGSERADTRFVRMR